MAHDKRATNRMLKELRKFGLSYPGAHFKSPWPGHMDLAVKDKTFCYLSLEGEPLGLSCKLKQTSEQALLLPFTKPTGYGLGRSGWVSANFDDRALPPIDMLKQWIDESYRAQAPKRLIKQIGDAPAPEKKATKKKATKKKATKKKAAKKKAAKKKR